MLNIINNDKKRPENVKKEEIGLYTDLLVNTAFIQRVEKVSDNEAIVIMADGKNIPIHEEWNKFIIWIMSVDQHPSTVHKVRIEQ